MRSQATSSFAPALILLAGAAAAVSGYLVASSRAAGLGFPLDDAWIHLTYARNLGLSGEWSFVPGQPSGGSTAPLWTGLLALGFLLRLPDPTLWAYFLGGASLVGLALAGENASRRAAGAAGGLLPWAGLFLAGEYHLVWAAASGMETVLMALLIVLALRRVDQPGARWEWTGALIGLAVWVRPDGITLLGPALFALALGGGTWKQRAAGGLRLLAGFATFFLPYLLFNLRIQGSLWPNTFYAKQAEYAVLQQRSLILRLADELSLPLVGAGMLLAPGFLVLLWHSLREKRWGLVGAALWFLGYAGLYAWRLPVTYQYGRYLIPAMAVFFILGLAGSARLVRAWNRGKAGRLAGFASAALLAGVWAGFYLLGARNYARDVAIIQSEMVAAAKWVAVNTAPGDLVAAHDIGAMGYFCQRDLVDLAGLITPEVIPFIRDEERLADYLDQRGVAVLVTFPGWYDRLASGREVLYATGGKTAPAAGGENLVVYRWR